MVRAFVEISSYDSVLELNTQGTYVLQKLQHPQYLKKKKKKSVIIGQLYLTCMINEFL